MEVAATLDYQSTFYPWLTPWLFNTIQSRIANSQVSKPEDVAQLFLWAEIMDLYLTISSGKQLFIILIYSFSDDPGTVSISCTRFSAPVVTNNLRALASFGKICSYKK